jgi:hypothetical protein
MTDKQLASQLTLIERAYLVLTIWAEDYSNIDEDHQQVIDDLQKEIKRITKELEQKVKQEPVAWIGNADFVKGQFVEGRVRRIWWECNTGVGQPLYTEPPRKPWVGLTNEEIEDLDNFDYCEYGFPNNFVRAIELKLKELNT